VRHRRARGRGPGIDSGLGAQPGDELIAFGQIVDELGELSEELRCHRRLLPLIELRGVEPAGGVGGGEDVEDGVAVLITGAQLAGPVAVAGAGYEVGHVPSIAKPGERNVTCA